MSATIQNGSAPSEDRPTQKLTFEEVPDSSGTTGSTVVVPTGSAPANGAGEAAPAGAAPADGAGAGAGAGAGEGAAGSPANAAAPGNSALPLDRTLVAPVGPTNNQPLPAIDKPAEAAQQLNQVPAGGNAQVATGANASGKPNKKKKAPYDKKDESSSKHKKKTGLDKINPL
jgi:outer membrane protein assembly factor BamD